jgi:hypothetical protein
MRNLLQGYNGVRFGRSIVNCYYSTNNNIAKALIGYLYTRLFELTDIYYFDYIAQNSKNVIKDMLWLGKEFNQSQEWLRTLTLLEYQKQINGAVEITKEINSQNK